VTKQTLTKVQVQLGKWYNASDAYSSIAPLETTSLLVLKVKGKGTAPLIL
jgi:hypothetical protein